MPSCATRGSLSRASSLWTTAGSYSKTISPGLRVGYAVANREIIAKFNLLKQGADVHTSNLSQAIVLKFLQRGHYDDHVEMLCNT